MAPNHPTATSGPSRRRLGRLTTTVLATLALLLGTVLAAIPAAAEDAAPAPSEPTTMPGRGSMDSDQIALSGPEVVDPPADAADPSARGAGDEGAKAEAEAGSTGWSQVIDLLDGTQMVALSWDGATSAPDGAVSLRTRTGDEPWSGWSALEGDPDDDGGEGTGRVGTGVTWLGNEGVDQVEVRIDAGPLVGLELLRMRYHEGEPVPVEDATGQAGRAATGKAAQPSIRPRSAWATRGWASGTSGCGSAPSVASRLAHAVVHHSASSNSYTPSQVPGLIDGIRAYHQSSLGWCDIAYNFVVDRFGGIWQGRAGDITKPVIGGHAKGFNTYSTGVVLLGQFEPGASPASGSPTSAMLDSTARLLAWKLSLHGLDPNGTTTVTSGGSTRYSAGTRVTLPVINPHQATGYTACPGANVMSQMPALRAAVTADMAGGSGGGPVVTDWTPFASVEALVYRQYVDFLRDPGSYGERLWWHQNLSSGATHRDALVVSLLGSNRLQDGSASIVRLYLAYFGRGPDHTGLRFWWDQMDGGRGLRGVSASFARSSEFLARYGQLSDEQFVDLVYRNVLDRAPDGDGYAFWTARLRAKRESRGGMMTLFSESGEYRAQRRDVVEVLITHEAMLGRSINSTETLFRWVARVSQDRTALIDTLFASAEYGARVGA